MDREELGKIVNRVRSRLQDNKVTWDELPIADKELACSIGEAVQRAVLQEYKGSYISVEEEGVRVLGDSSQIPKLLKFLEQNLPRFSFEYPQTLNLLSTVQHIIRGYKDSETKALSKLKCFKDDVLTYLRAIALVMEMAGKGGTHHEKDVLMRAAIAQIESAIERVRDEEGNLYDRWRGTPDLFRSDFPARRFLERIRELETENKKLKGEPSEQGNAGF